MRVRAFAKINLSLHVVGVRDDGYHELRTIFQAHGNPDVGDLEERITDPSIPSVSGVSRGEQIGVAADGSDRNWTIAQITFPDTAGTTHNELAQAELFALKVGQGPCRTG